MAKTSPTPPRAATHLRWVVGGLLACAGLVHAAEQPTVVPTPAVEALVVAAEAEIAKGAFEQARAYLHQALLLDSAYAPARQALARVEAIRAGDDVAHPVDREAIAAQLAVAEAKVLIERAELLARQGRPEPARQALESARGKLVGLEAHSDLHADVARIQHFMAEIEPVLVAHAEAGAAKERRQALDDASARAEREQVQQASMLEERIQRIRAHQRRQLLELALAGAHHLVRDFPGDVQAEELFEELLAQVHAQRNRDLEEKKDDVLREVHRRIEDALIPTAWDGRPDYPIDWHERAPRTHSLGGDDVAVEAWEEDLVDRLAQRVSVNFEDAPIDEALNALARMGNFNLVVDPSVYATGAVPINLRVTDMRLDHCLNWLAHMSSQSWVLAQGAVYFGGQADVQRVLAVYDLAYLLRVPADQSGYNIGFGQTDAAGGGFDLFQRDDTQVDQLAPEDVVDLIRTAVSPSSWEDPANAIEVRGNQLFVTAPRNLHALLQEFIRGQASARSLAVHVAARWLTIHDSAIEEIGVDWGSAESLVEVAAQPGVIQPGVLHSADSSAWYGTALNRLPALRSNISPPTSGTGLNLSLLRLGNIQVAATLTAVERKGRGRVLARPELVTLNGLRGNVFFGQQHAYIADYEVVNNNLDPVIEVLTIGASLDIKPFISADRKFVTMEFRPAIASVQFFTELITAPRIIGNGDGGGVIIPGLPFPIELPNVQIDEVSTQVIVPDGGSLMVGGFNFALDEHASSGVPFLSHIPFFGRLFGRRGRYQTRERLFLLAHVRIIDYQEAEDRL